MSPEEENSKWYIFFEFPSTVNFAKKKFQFSDNLYWSLFLTTKFWWLTRSIVDHWAVTLMGDCSSTSKLVSRKNFFPLSPFFFKLLTFALFSLVKTHCDDDVYQELVLVTWQAQKSNKWSFLLVWFGKKTFLDP